MAHKISKHQRNWLLRNKHVVTSSAVGVTAGTVILADGIKHNSKYALKDAAYVAGAAAVGTFITPFVVKTAVVVVPAAILMTPGYVLGGWVSRMLRRGFDYLNRNDENYQKNRAQIAELEKKAAKLKYIWQK